MTEPHQPAPEDPPPLWAELSDAPAAARLASPSAEQEPVAATLADTQHRPVVSVDRDRWFVEQSSGRRTGPLSWPDLLGCVKAKMFFADDVVYGEINSHRLCLRDLFPTVAIRDPGPIVDPLPNAWQQLAEDPLKTAIFGPQVRPYQKTDPDGLHYASNLRLVAALGMFYLLVWTGGWVAVLVGFPGEKLDGPLFLNCAAGLFLGLGLLNFTAALLEWEFIFNYRKIRWRRSLYGDVATRRYLLRLSWVSMGIGLLLILLVLSLAWK